MTNLHHERNIEMSPLFGKKKDKDPDDKKRVPSGGPSWGDVRDLSRADRDNQEALRAAAVQRVMTQGSGTTLAEQLERAQRLQGHRPGAPDTSQLVQMVDQFSAAGTGKPTAGSWIDAIVHPQTDFMRQCKCEQCGGPKKLPSPSAYMYCDYCGALVDFDVRMLVRGSENIANPAQYAATMNEIGARSRDAKAAGDRDAYARLRHQFYDAWVTTTPKAASHRVGDPSYRAAFIDYLVAGSLATDFDPSYQACEEQVKQAVLGLRRDGMQVDPSTFWPLVDAYVHQQEVAAGLARGAEVADLDPDHASVVVRHRIAMSAMVQGWMTSLSPDAGEELIERTGLQGEYKRIEPITDGSTRHCGKCGAGFTAVAGAKSAICDHCGHQLDVGSAEWSCDTCGALVTMPSGATETTCPYCKGLVSRVGR